MELKREIEDKVSEIKHLNNVKKFQAEKITDYM